MQRAAVLLALVGLCTGLEIHTNFRSLADKELAKAGIKQGLATKEPEKTVDMARKETGKTQTLELGKLLKPNAIDMAKINLTKTAATVYKDLAYNPKIDIYVINMAHRTDKCNCMKNQLNDLPANVFRQIPPAGEECNIGNFDHGNRWGAENGETSLFCANRKIWEQAQKRDAEYIIILEDDSIMAEGWFERVREMTQCKDWEHLNLDTWEDNAESRDGYREDLCNNAGFMNHMGYGSQAQIIKKTFLKELLRISDEVQGALDTRFIRNHLHGDIGSYRWMPGLVNQFHVNGQSAEGIEGCSGGWTSDIAFSKKVWQKGWGSPERMKC